MNTIQSILFLCPVVFLASFVDAISGGGGLLSLPVTLCGVLGSYVGAGMAIKKGARFIRPMMLLIAFLLILKMVFDVIASNAS